MIYKTQEELDQALAYWQKVLQLQDWEVKASVERKKDITLDDVDAMVSWYFTHKKAIVRLLDPIDYNELFDQDHEYSLVHELLHLHFAGFDTTAKESLEEKLLEQCINALSTALVSLKRAGSSSSVLTGLTLEVASTFKAREGVPPTPQLKIRGLPLEAVGLHVNAEYTNTKNGSTYVVKGFGRHSETMAHEVEYVDSEGERWHRPIELFLEKFTKKEGV